LVIRLSGLYKTIQARLELQDPLLALSGRLDLVVSQIELRREAAMVKAATTEEVVDYIEGQTDSDDDEQAGEVEDVVIHPTNELSSDEEDSDGPEGDETAISGFLDLEAEESDEGQDFEVGSQESEEEMSSEEEASDDEE
jgi:U3 small nucleolar RNA-associated protein 5